MIDAIYSQGGKVVASGVPNCIVVVGSKRTFQVSNLIEQGVYDVISCGYIIECLERNTLIPLTSLYYLGYSPETRTRLLGVIDPLGDNYTVESNYRELQHLLYDTMNNHSENNGNGGDGDVAVIQRLEKTCKNLELSIALWEKTNKKCEFMKHRKRQKKIKEEKEKMKMKRAQLKEKAKKSAVVVARSKAKGSSITTNDSDEENDGDIQIKNYNHFEDDSANEDDDEHNNQEDEDEENDSDNDEEEEEEESCRIHMAEIRALYETRLVLRDYKNFTCVTTTSTAGTTSTGSSVTHTTGRHSSSGLQWREIAKWMVDEERSVLDVGRANCLYSPDIIFYVDTGQDLGDLQPTTTRHSRKTTITTTTTTQQQQQQLQSSSSVPIAIQAMKSRLKLYGAQISEHLHVGVTHIVIMNSNSVNQDRLNDIKIRLRLLRLQEGYIYEKLLVTPPYIQACIEAETVIEPISTAGHLVVMNSTSSRGSTNL